MYCHRKTSPGCLFRGWRPLNNPTPGREERSDTRLNPRKTHLYCATCRCKITQQNHQISIDGKQAYTFFNPRGMVFHIGCFRKASGCLPHGTASTEFSWFAGFSWQIVVCAKCRAHLGWMFSRGTEEHFFGLVLARLRRHDEPSSP